MAAAAAGALRVPAPGVRGLADREDHVLDELRQEQDVGYIRVQRLLEQPCRPAGSDDQDRSTRVLTDACKLIRRQRAAPRGMKDGVQVTAGEHCDPSGDIGAGADELDFRMACKRLAQLVEPFTGSGCEEPHALTLGCFSPGHQCGLLPGPSNCMVKLS